MIKLITGGRGHNLRDQFSLVFFLETHLGCNPICGDVIEVLVT